VRAIELSSWWEVGAMVSGWVVGVEAKEGAKKQKNAFSPPPYCFSPSHFAFLPCSEVMLRHLARSIAQQHMQQVPLISEATRTHAALALAAAWRRAASSTTSGSGRGGGDSAAGHAPAGAPPAASEPVPTSPPRIAEMAALFTCNVCGALPEGERRSDGRRGDSPSGARLSSLNKPPVLSPSSVSSDHRSAHGFSRAAYERGVVIVTCASCASRHLLSDRLGWFGEAGGVEKFLAEREGGGGGGVRERAVTGSGGGAGGTLELTAEELDGWTKKA